MLRAQYPAAVGSTTVVRASSKPTRGVLHARHVKGRFARGPALDAVPRLPEERWLHASMKVGRRPASE